MTRITDWNVLDCTNCMLDYESLAATGNSAYVCPHCNKSVAIQIFPKLFERKSEGRVGERVLSPEESSCYYHPEKRASIPCDSCGRFLCELCDVELHGQHLCANCIDRDVRRQPGSASEQTKLEFVRYDQIALTLSIVAWLLSFFSPILLLPAIYLIVRYWNKPVSATGKKRGFFAIAAFFALANLAFWIFLIVAIVTGSMGG